MPFSTANSSLISTNWEGMDSTSAGHRRVWPPVCQCSVTEYVVATIGYCSLVPCFVDAYCVPNAHGLWNAPLSGLSSHGDSNGSKCSGSGPSTMP